MKVGFGSTSVTSNWGSARRSARAQVAPPKPPPMMTMRGLAWLSDSLGENATAVAAPIRKARLVVLITVVPPPRRRSPGSHRRKTLWQFAPSPSTSARPSGRPALRQRYPPDAAPAVAAPSSPPRRSADDSPSMRTRRAAAPLRLCWSRFPVPAAAPSPASLRSAPSPALQERGCNAPGLKLLSRIAGAEGPSAQGLVGEGSRSHRLQVLVLQRQRANAFAGRGEDRIA